MFHPGEEEEDESWPGVWDGGAENEAQNLLQAARHHKQEKPQKLDDILVTEEIGTFVPVRLEARRWWAISYGNNSDHADEMGVSVCACCC